MYTHRSVAAAHGRTPVDIQQGCFSGVMLAVGRLVRTEKTMGDKVISNSTLTTRLLILDMRQRLEIGR